MVTTEKRILTVAEAALMLSAHPNSVRRWAEAGLLPYFRLGIRGDRRFKREDVERLLESWQTSSTRVGA